MSPCACCGEPRVRDSGLVCRQCCELNVQFIDGLREAFGAEPLYAAKNVRTGRRRQARAQ
jgi:hypothetical protein